MTKMRQKRRLQYRKAAYTIRLQEVTAAMEELAESILRSELVEFDLPQRNGMQGAAKREGDAAAAAASGNVP